MSLAESLVGLAETSQGLAKSFLSLAGIRPRLAESQLEWFGSNRFNVKTSEYSAEFHPEIDRKFQIFSLTNNLSSGKLKLL